MRPMALVIGPVPLPVSLTSLSQLRPAFQPAWVCASCGTVRIPVTAEDILEWKRQGNTGEPSDN